MTEIDPIMLNKLYNSDDELVNQFGDLLYDDTQNDSYSKDIVELLNKLGNVVLEMKAVEQENTFSADDIESSFQDGYEKGYEDGCVEGV